VNTPLVKALHTSDVAVSINRVDAAEIDEMWSFVGKKQAPRWLWHALAHQTRKVLASVFGRRHDDGFRQLKALLEPCGLTRFLTDQWGRMPGSWPPKRMSLGNAIRSRWNGSM